MGDIVAGKTILEIDGAMWVPCSTVTANAKAIYDVFKGNGAFNRDYNDFDVITSVIMQIFGRDI